MLAQRIAPARVALMAVSLAAIAHQAHGTLQFQKAFLQEHIAEHADRDFAKFVQRKAKCNVCHQGCKDRTQQNRYGAELARLLDHRADTNDTEKIAAALRAVAGLPSDPSQTGSPTFGERIKNSKLPAGELDELRREPAE